MVAFRRGLMLLNWGSGQFDAAGWGSEIPGHLRPHWLGPLRRNNKRRWWWAVKFRQEESDWRRAGLCAEESRAEQPKEAWQIGQHSTSGSGEHPQRWNRLAVKLREASGGPLGGAATALFFPCVEEDQASRRDVRGSSSLARDLITRRETKLAVEEILAPEPSKALVCKYPEPVGGK